MSRKDFLSLQQRFIRMRSMVYKNKELELTCGESRVTYHSLCYDKDQEQANAILCSIQGAEDESPKHHRTSINESRVEAVKPCSDDYKPQQDHGEELSAQINVVELSSFSFRLDFLAF